MQINKKIIIIAVIIIAVSWIFNIRYYDKHMQKEPIFRKRYYSSPNVYKSISLNYTDNIKSKDKIVSISFPELDEKPAMIRGLSTINLNIYTKMVTIDVEIFSGEMKDLPENYEDKVITKAKVTFSNNKVMDFDIGKIYLYTYNYNKSDFLTRKFSSSSSENYGETGFVCNEDLQILGINNRLSEETKDILKINVQGQELSNIKFPINMRKGDEFKIDYSMKFKKGDIRAKYYYYIGLDVLVENSEGNKMSVPYGFMCSVSYSIE